MADYSSEEHYNMLENMLRGTKKYLCQLFQRRWRDETGKDWEKLSIPEKISILSNSAFHNAKCIESIARSAGNLEDCELVLLSSAILSFRRVEKYAKENDAVTAIKNLRESLAPKYSGKTSSHDYKKEREIVRNSLKCLGVNKKEIDDIIFQMKRGRPHKACSEKVTKLFKVNEKFRKKGDNEDLLQIRNVDAPGEDLFRKGVKYIRLAKEGHSENWVQAASHFRQAAKKGHVEAITYLGICFVKANDFAEARKLFEKAAGMDAKSPGAFTLYKCNIGVAGAQKRLELMYFRGQNEMNTEEEVFFSKEFGHTETADKPGGPDKEAKHAAFWFEKAMENGNGSAALNLAVLYSLGCGVGKNNSMARFCFKESINLKCARAFVPLSEYYLKSFEPEKATHISNMRIAKVSTISSRNKEKYFDNAMTFARKRRTRWERQVENFEKEYGLHIKGLTFWERLVRPFCYSNDNTEKFEIFEESIFSAHTFHCFGTADFIEGDPMLEIYPYQQLFQLMEKKQELTEDDKLQALKWVYQILSQGPRLVPMRELTDKGIGKILESLRQEEKYKEQGELDEQLRLCCAAFNLFSHCDETKSIQMLVEMTQRYPDNYTYRTILCLYLGQKENWTWGLRTAEEGLKVDPKNVELMYLEAVFFSFLHFDTQFEECVAKFENFLGKVLEKDPIFPDACYAISAFYLQKLENEMKPTARFRYVDTDLVTSNFKRGLQAEAVQLDWFQPYRTSSVKLKVGLTIISCEFDMEAGKMLQKAIRKITEEQTVLERKMYLRSPTRKGLIKLHHQNIKDKKEDNIADSNVKQCKYVEITDSPKHQQTLSDGLSSLKPITLLEINPTVENIFKDRVLELTVLVVPHVNSGLLASVAEDKDGDVIRVHVYNFQVEKNIAEKFSIGSRIAVINPYLSMTKWDLHSCIRIDDLRCVIFLRNVRNMCGFCGEEDSSHTCSKCQRIYCSKECEDLDEERHGHNLVCSYTVK